jgi:hypothetical protein
MDHIPWWLDQAEVVITIIGAILSGAWYFGRHLGRIETSVEGAQDELRRGFESNDEAHERIIEKLDNHGERLAKVEADVADHRERYK